MVPDGEQTVVVIGEDEGDTAAPFDFDYVGSEPCVDRLAGPPSWLVLDHSGIALRKRPTGLVGFADQCLNENGRPRIGRFVRFR